MWDFSFVVPCALMMFTLLGFYFTKPHLPIRLNSTFLQLLVIELLVLGSDVVSTKVDENYALFSPVALYVANTAFFVAFVARIYWFSRFSLHLTNANMRSKPVLGVLFVAPFLVFELICLTTFATGAVFSVQDGAYARGPWYHVTTVSYYFYIFVTVGVILAHRKTMRGQDLAGALAYNAALMIGILVRTLLPRVLVMDTFCMVAITIIYLAFLNPDLYLSDHGMAFNMRAFRLLMEEPARRDHYSLLGFAMQNYNHERSIIGSAQADQLVSLVCRYLNKTFPNTLIFYLRGGRFALVGDSATDWDAVRDSIRLRFAKNWQTRDTSLHVGVSFAYVDSGTELGSADRIINNLMIALDNARRTHAETMGAAGGAMGPVSTHEVDQQVRVLHALERSLEEDTVEVFLQPVFDSRERRMVGAEALARIRDEEGNIVSPGVFVPIAEKSGHIYELGRQVLRKTCLFVKEHDMEALGLEWINVNLSPIQCLQQDLSQEFMVVLGECDVAAGMIRLEITEQSIIDFTMLERQIMALVQDGFRFVLDDYGSGYSNLMRVRRYPFMSVKLDMELVWDYCRERDGLLPAIVQGFKQSGLSVTAEGIETEEMADALTSIGSDYLQGYLFSKPLPPDQFVLAYAR